MRRTKITGNNVRVLELVTTLGIKARKKNLEYVDRFTSIQCHFLCMY